MDKICETCETVWPSGDQLASGFLPLGIDHGQGIQNAMDRANGSSRFEVWKSKKVLKSVFINFSHSFELFFGIPAQFVILCAQQFAYHKVHTTLNIHHNVTNNDGS